MDRERSSEEERLESAKKLGEYLTQVCGISYYVSDMSDREQLSRKEQVERAIGDALSTERAELIIDLVMRFGEEDRRGK